jgi:hypothetical protein
VTHWGRDKNLVLYGSVSASVKNRVKQHAEAQVVLEASRNSVHDRVQHARRDSHCKTEHHAKHIVDDGPDEYRQVLCSLSHSCQLSLLPRFWSDTHRFETQLLSDIDNQQSR